MSQAFDNVSHVYLMRKLQKYAKKNPQLFFEDRLRLGKRLKINARLARRAVARYINQKVIVGLQFSCLFLQCPDQVHMKTFLVL